VEEVDEADDADSVVVDAVVVENVTASGNTTLLRNTPPRLCCCCCVTGYSTTRRGDDDDVKELHVEAPEEMPNRSSSDEGHEVAICLRIFLFFDVTPIAMMILWSFIFSHFMASIIS